MSDFSIDILQRELNRTLKRIEDYESFLVDSEARAEQERATIKQMEERAVEIEAAIERLRVGL